MSESAGEWLKSQRVSFWVWSLLLVLFLGAALYVAGQLWSQRTELQAHSAEQGQHISIDLASGEIHGNVRRTPKPEASIPPSLPGASETAEAAPLTTPAASAEVPSEATSDASGAESVTLPQTVEAEAFQMEEAATAETASQATTSPDVSAEPPVDMAGSEMALMQQAQAEPNATSQPSAASAGSGVQNSGDNWPRAPLKPSPNLRLVQKIDEGYLPKVSSDGELPWQFYGRPFILRPGVKPIAILIPNLGLSKRSTEAALQLPSDMSLVISPYSRDATVWANQARALGHEVLLALAQEEEDYPASDPGPYGMLTELAPDENLKRLHWQLSRFTGYVGVYSPSGDKFTASPAGVALQTDLSRRGLMYVYGNVKDPAGYAEVVRGGVGLPGMKIDAVIDQTPTTESIREALKALEKTAMEKGQALGLAHAYPVTLEALHAWAKELESRDDVMLAPLTAVVSVAQSAE